MRKFSAGTYIRQNSYRAFIPNPINRRWTIDDAELQRKLSRADRYLGRLDAFSDLVDIDLYVRLHVRKEATLSAKIEGTQTSVEEAVLDRKDVSAERRDDWDEVNNYVLAINQAIAALKDLPFSSRLVRNTHATLMQGVRGQQKGPGEFRRSQNWIGGTSISRATFVPPPPQEINHLMSDLEKLANDDNNPLPELLKIALIHYQFETIHPFQDGNGRLGRLLIPLYLIGNGIIRQPVLYLSAYLERNRQLYYDSLMDVRLHDDLLGWYHFFLDGVIETAGEGVETFKKVIQLERSLPQRLTSLGRRRGTAEQLLRAMFGNPIMSVSDVKRVIELSDAPTYRLVSDLERLRILEEFPTAGRGKSFVFREYMDLFT
jgi:Fic family protein